MKLSGECRAGCGNCCRVLVMPLPSPEALHQTEDAAFVPLPLTLDADAAAFYDTRGVEVVLSSVPNRGAVARVPKAPGSSATAFDVMGTWFARVPSVCPHLRADGRCRIYEDRPTVCREGPTLFERLHVLGADECAIRVEE